MLATSHLGWERVAAIGDDWPDLPILRRAAFACAPPQAHVEVRAVAHHVTQAAAGFGAAREFCDLLLIASGRYAELLNGPLVRSRWHAMRSMPSPPAPGSRTTRSISASPVPNRSPPRPGRCACVDLASAYLPLLMMAALARRHLVAGPNAPSTDTPRAAVAPRHEADYVMTRFVVQRFGSDGALRTQIEGDRLRHFPDDDTLEIDHAKIRAIGSDGVVTLAVADRALANGDGSEVQLLGNAHVTRPAAASRRTPSSSTASSCRAFRNIERVRSHLPVVVTQGQSVIHAEGMEYDNLARIVDLKGRNSAHLRRAPTRTAAR